MYFDELGMDDRGEGLSPDWREVRHVVAALTDAATIGDERIRNHVLTVAYFTRLISASYQFDAQELETITHGALLHDIGKLSVPHSVLVKPGPLTQAERRLIHRHPEAGERIVRPVRNLGGTLEIIRHHHERFDGTGYPDGLAGERVPLFARIVSAADAISAMLFTRPYRGRLPVREVIAEIRRESAGQFDPTVAEIAIAVLEEEYSSRTGRGLTDGTL